MTEKQNTKKWYKSPVSYVLFLTIPLMYYLISNSLVFIKAVSHYDADIGEAFTLVKRSDKDYFYDNTPNIESYPIVSTKEELDALGNDPLLINFYKIHCPYCEISHESFEKTRQDFIKKYPEYADRVVYVMTKSDIGQELIYAHNIPVAASMLLLDSDNGTVLDSSQTTEKGIVAHDKNIRHAFDTLTVKLTQTAN